MIWYRFKVNMPRLPTQTWAVHLPRVAMNGQVWINEEHLGLEFGCNTCLNPPAEPPGGSLDDVLDLDEAAAASGLAGPVIERAAQLGHVKHRKTASGVLLFTRADVLAFAATH